jgi:hypothetical protein
VSSPPPLQCSGPALPGQERAPTAACNVVANIIEPECTSHLTLKQDAWNSNCEHTSKGFRSVVNFTAWIK